MKQRFFISVFCLCNFFLQAGPNLRQQLEELNQYWKNKDHQITNSLIDTRFTEVSLIKCHLSLVEKTLRAKDLSALTAKQIKNRSHCLDILIEYTNRGLFPQNYYHSKRTPYFIDMHGTACAVGQLIIITGNAALAEKISKENNYGYITDLVKKYPEIILWANEYGFTVDELAWIQPCYGLDPTPGLRNVSCHGGFDGYWVPDVSHLPQPCQLNLFRFNGQIWDQPPLPCFPNYLTEGLYKMVVTDSAKVVHTYTMYISEPPKPEISVNFNGNYITCDASATVSVNGGADSLTYYWMPGAMTSSIVNYLCEQKYYLTVIENIYCRHYLEFFVGQVALAERENLHIKLFPNPVQDKLYLELKTNEIPKSLKIYNVAGRLEKEIHLDDISSTIDTKDLIAGIYFILLEVDGEMRYGKFVKE